MKKNAKKPSKSRVRLDGFPDSILEVPIQLVLPSPENDELYGPCDLSNPDDADLSTDVAKNGVLEPIGITRDWFVVTGHRRLWAAKTAGLTTIPVRLLDIWREHYSQSDWVRLLRQHNFQRERTLDEHVREELVDIDPEDAYQVLTEHRRERAVVTTETFSIVGVKSRKAVSDAKRFMVAAIQRVLRNLGEFWPLSDRQVHYQLLNNPPLIHASKPNSVYANNKRSYDALVELLTRLRLDGTIPMEAIADETRPSTIARCHASTTPFLAQEIDWFLKGYRRNRQQSQPNYIEVFAEKNTVMPILSPVVDEFCIRLTAMRGYISLPPRIELANRFHASGKKKLVLLILSDLDPDGVEIGQSLARSMRDDFGIGELYPVRVALTREQVVEHQLPPQLKAKSSSSQYSKFARQFGDDAYELEALPPEVLQGILRNAIEDALDIRAFNSEVAAEKNDAAELLGLRGHVIRALQRMNLGNGGPSQ
jgi:hypothetical protein